MRRNEFAARSAALVVGVIACGGARSGAESRVSNPVHLSVTNTNWADVAVYTVRGLTRSRIGFVTSLNTKSFLVRRSAMPDGTLRLMIDPVGSDKTFVTEAIVVTAGQRVEFTVMPAMTMSTFAVRVP